VGVSSETIKEITTTLRRWGRRSPVHGAWRQLRWYTTPSGRRQLVQMIRYAGLGRCCPYCGWQGRLFHPAGQPARADGQCPRCYAKERHRALYFYLEEWRSRVGPRGRVLEIAPEPHSLRYWRNRPSTTYVGLDLYSPLAALKGDILALPLPDQAFDLIVCLHVLEHIQDDRSAMVELKRVLHPRGELWIQVPIDRAVTFEDPTITAPNERERLFGQGDHVRAYGWDLVSRLEAAGLNVAVEEVTRGLPEQLRRRAGILPGETILVCTYDSAKPSIRPTSLTGAASR
jgi:SAM-dependent methyltransferase